MSARPVLQEGIQDWNQTFADHNYNNNNNNNRNNNNRWCQQSGLAGSDSRLSSNIRWPLPFKLSVQCPYRKEAISSRSFARVQLRRVLAFDSPVFAQFVTDGRGLHLAMRVGRRRINCAQVGTWWTGSRRTCQIQTRLGFLEISNSAIDRANPQRKVIRPIEKGWQ